ncbi:MAG: sensor domain-containing diguanylate cyclase [Sphaerochaetaceae bacterium]|nr:sensor domain-containing diguanylate cyclase [Sphaerochaetaceae bacterium]
MLASLRLIVMVESTDATDDLASRLKERIPHLVRVDSMVDGLAFLKRQRFDAAILSADMVDFYPTRTMEKILKEVGSIRAVLLVSSDSAAEGAISLEDRQSAFSRILRKLESIREEPLASDHGQETSPGVHPESLFDSVPVGLFRIDKEGGLIELNKTMASMLGISRQAAVQSGNLLSCFTDPDARKTWMQSMEKEHAVRSMVCELSRADGNSLWIRTSARPVYDAQGNLLWHDGSVEDITVQKRLEERLSFLATQDILTGLPNRNFFQDQAKLTLSQACYSDDSVAILIIDIDRFAMVNEEFGIKGGDKILQMSALRIKEQLRKSDLVARLDRDRFIVLLNGIHTKKDAFTVARKICLAFTTPFALSGSSLLLSASIGIALSPEHGDEVNTVIKRAEMALYVAKERDRGRAVIYSDILHGGGGDFS